MKSDTLGIIGGGQLGMFMCMAAKKIGAKTIVFSTERNFSAKSFCDRYIQGSFDDKIKLNEFINMYCTKLNFTAEYQSLHVYGTCKKCTP